MLPLKARKEPDISHVESTLSQNQPLALKGIDRLDLGPLAILVSNGEHCRTELFLLIAAWLVQLHKRKRHRPVRDFVNQKVDQDVACPIHFSQAVITGNRHSSCPLESE